MITGEKGSRLSKIARELNVGISTLVEFLQKQGIKISSDPNTKIEADVHELLEKQFRKDHEARMEADKVNLRHHRAKNESISIEDIQVENKESDEPDNDDDSIMIKDHSLHHYKEEKRPEPVQPTPKPEATAPVSKPEPPPPVSKPEPAPVIDIEKPKVKVVGQVDLDNLKRKPKSKVEKAETPVEEKPVKEEVNKVKESPKVEEKPIVEPPVEKKEVVAESPVEAEVPEPEKVEEKPEMISNIPVIENTVKILGKIDLDANKAPERTLEKPKKGIILNKKKLTTHKANERFLLC